MIDYRIKRLRCLPLEHQRAGDLVGPALLASVERHPDDADEADEEGNEEANPSQQSLADRDPLARIRVDHAQLEDALTEGAALLGPHVRKVSDVDYKIEQARRVVRALPGIGWVHPEDGVDDARDNGQDDDVDDVRHDPDPEASAIGA